MWRVVTIVLFVFFFFKQKTAYEMRISDWSSDVCSSDLPPDTAVCERSWMTRESYLIGYARVSKGDDQSNATQRRALDALGCKRVFEETASGGRWDRPKLLEMIGQLREGDVVVVWKLDRLSRSLKRSEEHTSEIQSLKRISYAVFGLQNKQRSGVSH